jgi:hypothetical protein
MTADELAEKIRDLMREAKASGLRFDVIARKEGYVKLSESIVSALTRILAKYRFGWQRADNGDIVYVAEILAALDPEGDNP